jgi:3-dehydroquinate synthase
MQKGKPIAHGIAVAAGILVESYLSTKYYHLEESSFKEIEAFVVKYFPKVKFGKEDIGELLTAIGQDKKKEKNANRFTLLDDLGKASINHNLESKAIEEGFDYYLKLY